MKFKKNNINNNSKAQMSDSNIFIILVVVLLILVLPILTNTLSCSSNRNLNKQQTIYKSNLLNNNSQNILPGKTDDNDNYHNYSKVVENFQDSANTTTAIAGGKCLRNITAYRTDSSNPWDLNLKFMCGDTEVTIGPGSSPTTVQAEIDPSVCSSSPLKIDKTNWTSTYGGNLATFNDKFDIWFSECISDDTQSQVNSSPPINVVQQVPETTKSLFDQCQTLLEEKSGFRNLNGATFIFEHIQNSNLYYIVGEDGKLLTCTPTDDHLSYTIKNIDNSENQLFVKEEKHSDVPIHGLHQEYEGTLYYFRPKIDSEPRRALQIEHGAITLRPLYVNKNDPTKIQPYKYQLFRQMDFIPNTDGVLLNIGPVVEQKYINNQHGLHNLSESSVSQNPGSVSNNSGSSSSSGNSNSISQINNPQNLNQMTNNQVAQVTNAVSNDIANLETGGNGLRLEVNLSGLNNNNDSNNSPLGETFADGNSTTLKMKNLIDTYETNLNKKNKESNFLNSPGVSFEASSGSTSSVPKEIENILRNSLSGNQIKKCPSLNLDEYYNKNQISTCYGCDLI